MIFVVGVGRTGTSVVAKVLEERLGVDMGGPGMPDDANPDGDWEEGQFAELAWALWSKKIGTSGWAERAKQIAAAKVEPWGVKHPVHSEFIPLIMETFPSAVWIWCKRDLLDTWQSWLRNFHMNPEPAWALVNHRHWAIQVALLERQHMEIDLTRRLEEEELARALGEGIEVIAPGTLNNGNP